MKIKILTILAAAFVASAACPQSNTFPTNGNVGIGAENVWKKLSVGGDIMIDYPQSEYTGNVSSLKMLDNAIIFKHHNHDKHAEIRGAIAPGMHTTSLLFRTKTYYNTPYDNTMFIHSSGKVGIGSVDPWEKLSVSGNILIDHPQSDYVNGPSELKLLENALLFKYHNHDKHAEIRGAVAPGTHTTGLLFRTKPSYNLPYDETMFIHPAGRVGIGTTDPDHELSVNGTIQAKEVIVETGWSDFVFEDGYYLRALEEVENHIEEYGHLPDVPSASVVESEGLSVGEAQKIMMQKIEELTLYMIDLKKENEALKTRMAQFESN